MASEQSSRRARNEREGERDHTAQATVTNGGHPADEVLPAGPMFVYGLQHVMSMYAGVVAVPLIFYEGFSSWFETIFESGISAAAITAILLNLLFNGRRGQPEEAPIFAESPAPGLTPEYQPGGHLAHEDAFTDTHRPTDVDQGPLPPRMASPTSPTSPPLDDKETPR